MEAANFYAEHDVVGLNAGPEFHLDQAFSFYLRVDGQEEVDHCWCKDNMGKIDVAALQAAYDGS